MSLGLGGDGGESQQCMHFKTKSCTALPHRLVHCTHVKIKSQQISVFAFAVLPVLPCLAALVNGKWLLSFGRWSSEADQNHDAWPLFS